MRTRRRIFFVALLIAIFGALAWFALAPRKPAEPTYQGRSLSQWMVAYQPRGFWGPGSRDQREADEAIRQMGTNSLPFLLEMLEAHDSNLKLQLVKLAQRQSLIKFKFQPAELKRAMAVCAFRALGPDARPAYPRLKAMFAQKAGQGRLPEAMCLFHVISPRSGTPASDDGNHAWGWTTTNEIIAVFGPPDKTSDAGRIDYDLGFNGDTKNPASKWTLSLDTENGKVAGSSMFSSVIPFPPPASSSVKP